MLSFFLVKLPGFHLKQNFLLYFKAWPESLPISGLYFRSDRNSQCLSTIIIFNFGKSTYGYVIGSRHAEKAPGNFFIFPDVVLCVHLQRCQTSQIFCDSLKLAKYHALPNFRYFTIKYFNSVENNMG